MKKLIQAYRDFKKAKELEFTKPKIIYSDDLGFVCTWWYSEQTINKLNAEIIYG